MSERGQKRELATKLGIDQGHLSNIVQGKKLPGLQLRLAFEDELRIPVRAWDEPPADDEKDPTHDPDPPTVPPTAPAQGAA